MNHVAIEPVLMQQALDNPQTKLLAEQYAQKYLGKKVIVGVDPCQRLSGVAFKFEAFEKFLLDDPKNARNVVLVQKCIRSGSRMEDEMCTSSELQSIAAAINNKFTKRLSTHSLSLPPAGVSTPPKTSVIEYEEVRSLSMVQRTALWLIGDVFMLTSLREGLNLMPMEYIYARRGYSHAGCIVASEFSLTSSLLSGSIKVNPFNVSAVADALEKAVYITEKDANNRRRRDINFVSVQTSSSWVKRIYQDMRQLANEEIKSEARSFPKPAVESTIVEQYANCLAGLDKTQIGSRVFIFDYGGTLVGKEMFDIYVKSSATALSERSPSPKVMQALKVLSSDPNNIVVVCTGLTYEHIGDVFEGLPNVSVMASHGMIYSWGENIRPIMSAYDAEDIRTKSLAISKVIVGGNREWIVRAFNVDWDIITKIAGMELQLLYDSYVLCVFAT